MTHHDLSSDAIADRVNCYALGAWIDALAENGGVMLQAPLGAGRQRVDIPIVTLGITVTLFRKVDDALSEEDQVVFHRVFFDPLRAILPFGLDGRTITPDRAKTALGDDTSGGRSADIALGDTRVSYFLPEDARTVQLTFHPSMLGIAEVQVFRLGGEIPYRDVNRLFGPTRRGNHLTL